MAWFLNKKTGLKWEVYGEHAERLAKDHDYEEIQNTEKKEPESKKQTKA